MTEPPRQPADKRPERLRPRAAATLILMDRTADEPRILMGRRHMRHRFMPGKFVFPGGGVETGDRFMMPAEPLAPAAVEKMLKAWPRASARNASALALAAIRETFEETGLLLGRRQAPPAAPQGVWRAFAAQGVTPALDGLHFIARAVTPPGRTRRFDAAFFAADASLIAHRVEGITGPDAELTELVWIPISRTGTLDLPTVTAWVLDELRLRLAAGMAHELPVPYFVYRHGSHRREEI